MSNYTKGPWNIQKTEDDSYSVIVENGMTEDDSDICTVYTEIGGLGDAHLIAAAPEMYKYIQEQAREGDNEAARIIERIG